MHDPLQTLSSYTAFAGATNPFASPYTAFQTTVNPYTVNPIGFNPLHQHGHGMMPNYAAIQQLQQIAATLAQQALGQQGNPWQQQQALTQNPIVAAILQNPVLAQQLALQAIQQHYGQPQAGQMQFGQTWPMQQQFGLGQPGYQLAPQSWVGQQGFGQQGLGQPQFGARGIF